MAWFGRNHRWFDQWVFYYYFICFSVLDLFLSLSLPLLFSIFLSSKNKHYA